MPADHRLRLDQNQRVTPAGPDAGQRHPEQTVGNPQLHPAPPTLPLEDQQLMPEGEQFGVEDDSRTEEIARRGHEREQDSSHGSILGQPSLVGKRSTIQSWYGVFGRDGVRVASLSVMLEM